MTRIASTFQQLKQQRPALIPFIMGGDPDVETAQIILNALPEAGADIIEIGIPFSDPMADGPVIQAAGLRALTKGVNIKAILGMVERFRQTNTTTPIVLMGYYNPIFHFGLEAFCAQASKAGVDGLIIVDLPPEEEAEFTGIAKAHALDFIRLIAPTSTGERLTRLTTSASGFIYYISVAGITGAKSANIESLRTAVTTLKNATPLPVAVGFGIKTPEQVAEIGAMADAVVVGSALVDVIAKNPTAAPEFVRSLAKALPRRNS